MKIKLRNSLDVLDPLQVALLANAPSLEKLSSKKQSIRHIKIFIVCELSHLQLFVTPWTVAPQAPLSMGFSRQEHCSGLLCPPPGALPDPGIELGAPALQADSLSSELPGKPISTSVCVC